MHVIPTPHHTLHEPSLPFLPTEGFSIFPRGAAIYSQSEEGITRWGNIYKRLDFCSPTYILYFIFALPYMIHHYSGILTLLGPPRAVHAGCFCQAGL